MDDLKYIKKHYGEKMMHLCRELFPSILAHKGLLVNLIESRFVHSKFLADDIIYFDLKNDFQDYIYNLIDSKTLRINVPKTPKELLDEVGYILYECKTESDIQKFKKYFEPEEELCTFKGGRLKTCYVFFAIKKNVDEIKRKDFPNPTITDFYATSVISIQFSRGDINTLSIKNRYNHIVEDSDATFSNNLEKIILGLTNSFEKEYGLNINQNDNDDLNINLNNNSDFEIPKYVMASDGKYYRYNYEINNVYYCPNNIIIDNSEVNKLEKEKYLVTDYFIIDLVNKKIKLYEDSIEDSFIYGLQNINKIEINKLKENKLITLTLNDNNIVYIEIDKYNRIINYKNEILKEIKDNFLYYNETLKEISISNVIKIGNNFLYENNALKKIDLSKVISIGNGFIASNGILEEINVLNVEKIGNSFLYKNQYLKIIDFPKIKLIGNGFLYFNKILQEINIPNVEIIGNNFLFNNIVLEKINLPNIKIIGNYFLYFNTKLKQINISDDIISTGKYFLFQNKLMLKEIIGQRKK